MEKNVVKKLDASKTVFDSKYKDLPFETFKTWFEKKYNGNVIKVANELGIMDVPKGGK